MKIAPRSTQQSSKLAAPSQAVTKTQARAIASHINRMLSHQDVGIDASQRAGTDITRRAAPAGTPVKAADLYKKWAAKVDPRDFQAAGAALYEFNLADVAKGEPNKPVWGVKKFDDKSNVMVLFDRDGELATGKLNSRGTYTWSVKER